MSPTLATTLVFPREASEYAARLLLTHLETWQLGVGNGVQRGPDGSALRAGERPALVGPDRRLADLAGDLAAWKACDAGFPVFRGGSIVAAATFEPEEQLDGDTTELGLRAWNRATGKWLLLMRVPTYVGSGRKDQPWTARIELTI